MRDYKSCIDSSMEFEEPNLDELIDEELANTSFLKHMEDVSEMIEEYGEYINDDF